MHYILRDSGLTATKSVLIVHGFHILYGGIGFMAIVATDIPESVFFYCWMAILAGHTIMVFKARSAEDFLSRLILIGQTRSSSQTSPD